jgi:hypothetical protein
VIFKILSDGKDRNIEKAATKQIQRLFLQNESKLFERLT